METRKRLNLVLVATILGSAVVLLDSTIVNLALAKIGVYLHSGFSSLQWVIDGYALSLSSLILLGGSLGDIFGRKKVYLIGLLGFGASSLLCALSPNINALILFRIIQGIFGALLVPGGLSLINTNFPKNQRGKAIGGWTAWTSIAVVFGPALGGFILDVASWRWIFLVNIPFVLLCFILAAPNIEESRDQSKRKVDIKGAAIGVLALAGLTYGLIQGPSQHWPVTDIVCLALGIIFAFVFVILEMDEKDPMVKLSLFKSRNFTGSNLMTFCMYGALSGFMVALAIYLQQHVGFSSLKTGLSTLPVSLIMFFFARKVGALSARFGPRLFMTIGPILCGLGIGSMYFLKHGDGYMLHVLPGILVFAVGLVMMVAPLTTTVMTSVNEVNSGIASGINNAVSRVAGLIVVAVLGLFGAAHYFQFSIILCSILAITAGLISFFYIQNKVLDKQT